MTRGLRLAVAVVLAGMLSACATREYRATEEGRGRMSAADIAAVRRVSQDFNEAYARNDRAAAIKAYAPDVVRLPPDGKPIVGREAVLRTWESLGVETKAWRFNSEEVGGQGNFAYERGTWEWTHTVNNRPDLSEITVSGNCLSILERQPDGSWLVIVESWSVHGGVPQH